MGWTLLCHGAGQWKRERERWFPIKFRGSCCPKWDALSPSLILFLYLQEICKLYMWSTWTAADVWVQIQVRAVSAWIYSGGTPRRFPTLQGEGFSISGFWAVQSPCAFSLSIGDLLTLNISGQRGVQMTFRGSLTHTYCTPLFHFWLPFLLLQEATMWAYFTLILCKEAFILGFEID